MFLGNPQQSSGVGFRKGISNSNVPGTGFLHAVVLRLVAASDLWEENCLLSEGSRVPERLRSRISRSNSSAKEIFGEEKGIEALLSLPRTNYLLVGCLNSADAEWVTCVEAWNSEFLFFCSAVTEGWRRITHVCFQLKLIIYFFSS